MWYWIMTLFSGIYIYLVPNGFTGKFNIGSPDNMYIGGFMIVVSSIALFVKLVQYRDKN